MINLDEYQKAREVKELLLKKVKENKDIMKEKANSINEAFNSFFNAKDSSSMDVTGSQMLASIAYDKSINNITPYAAMFFLMNYETVVENGMYLALSSEYQTFTLKIKRASFLRLLIYKIPFKLDTKMKMSLGL